MYKISYADVLEDNPNEARDRERQAIEHSIDLMQVAEKAGVESHEATEAVTFVTKLWSMLIEDLGSSDNDLPQDLKAHLISVGIWMLKQADSVRSGQSGSFKGMIEVSQAISEGLK